MERPAEAVFLVTEQKRLQAERLKRFAGERLGTRVSERVIPAYDMSGVTRICERYIEEHGTGDLTLNVTGGTKVSAMAAFEAFFSHGRRIIYVNTATDELLTLSPAEKRQPLPDVFDVRDYLAAYGLAMDKDSGLIRTKSKKRQDTIEQLTRILTQDPQILGALNSQTAPFLQGERRLGGYLYLAPAFFHWSHEALFSTLLDAGLATRGIDGGVNINGVADIELLGGRWLEEFVFHEVGRLGVKDARINVEIKWDGAGRKPTTNELDVLFTYRNRLHVISCKASDPERRTASGTRATAAIYELDALSDRIGGLFGRGMLVSARTLSEYDISRAERMHIRVVHGRNVPQLAASLIDWVRHGKGRP